MMRKSLSLVELRGLLVKRTNLKLIKIIEILKTLGVSKIQKI